MPRKAKIGATRSSHIYRVRVPVELQEQWDAWCARTDKKPSEVMRALMRYIVQDDMPAEVRDWIAAQAAGQPDDGPKHRPELEPNHQATERGRARQSQGGADREAGDVHLQAHGQGGRRPGRKS